MSDTKYTPGPWVVVGYDEEFKSQLNIMDFDKTYYVATAIGGMLGDTQKANANLIAASPELLEKLEQALEYIAWHNTELLNECLVLIKKAKGE